MLSLTPIELQASKVSPLGVAGSNAAPPGAESVNSVTPTAALIDGVTDEVGNADAVTGANKRNPGFGHRTGAGGYCSLITRSDPGGFSDPPELVEGRQALDFDTSARTGSVCVLRYANSTES
jgi:hypothetical protein